MWKQVKTISSFAKSSFIHLWGDSKYASPAICLSCVVNIITQIKKHGDKQQQQSTEKFLNYLFMYKVYLVPYNSFDNKPIFTYIYLPKLVSTEQFWSTFCTNTLLAEICYQYKLWFFKKHCPSTIDHMSFLLYQENNVFLAFIKITVKITIAPLSIDGLAYFWRWTTLIGSLELKINTSSNIFNSLQQ